MSFRKHGLWPFLILVFVIGVLLMFNSAVDTANYDSAFSEYLVTPGNVQPYDLDTSIQAIVGALGKDKSYMGLQYLTQKDAPLGTGNWYVKTSVEFTCSTDVTIAQPFGTITFVKKNPDGSITVDPRSTRDLVWTRWGLYDFRTTVDLGNTWVEFAIDIDTLDCYDSNWVVNVFVK